MIGSLTVGIAAAVIMQQSQSTQSQTRGPRIKSAQTKIAFQVRQAMFDPVSYEACGANCVRFKSEKIANAQEIIAGADCGQEINQCGVVVEDILFDQATSDFSARVVYQGTEVPIAPEIITGIVPENVYRRASVICPAATPLLACSPVGATNEQEWPCDDPYDLDFNYVVRRLICTQQYCPSGVTTTTTTTTTTTLPPIATCSEAGLGWSAMGMSGILRQACFVAGTKVSLSNGNVKSIEDVAVGDVVQTFDEYTQKMTTSPVSRIEHHAQNNHELFTMKFDDGKKVTSNDVHQFFIVNIHNYRSAKEIYRLWVQGVDIVLLNDSQKPVRIVEILRENKSVPLYNLHVKSPYDTKNRDSGIGHNYFAEGVLVHNIKDLNSTCSYGGYQLQGPNGVGGYCQGPMAMTPPNWGPIGYCCSVYGSGFMSNACASGNRCNECEADSPSQAAQVQQCMNTWPPF